MIDDPGLTEIPLGDLPGDPDPDEVADLLGQYAAEGHRVMFGYLDDADPLRREWFAVCSCGDGSPGPQLKNECRWWQRRHRSSHGLEWQTLAEQASVFELTADYSDN